MIQETISEAAEAKIKEYIKELADIGYILKKESVMIAMEYFKHGANWKEKHSYSEQEVRDVIEQVIKRCYEFPNVLEVYSDLPSDSVLKINFDDLLIKK